VADNQDKKPAQTPDGKPATATPGFDPKPVRLGDDSILDRLLPHMKKIVYALVAASVVLGVIFFFVWLRDRKRAAATEKLATVVELGERPVKGALDLPDPQEGSGSAAKPNFGDAHERAVALIDALAKSDADPGPSYRGSLLVQVGKLDEAIAEFRKGQTKTGLEGVLSREGLGLALEMRAEANKTDANARQQGLQEALAVFQAMQPDDAGPRRAYALYHQGRVLAELGKTADAKAALSKAKDLGGSTDLPPLIDERLAQLGAS